MYHDHRHPAVRQRAEAPDPWRRSIGTPTRRRSATDGPISSNAAATLDHLILKVNDLDASVAFYTSILGFFAVEGTDGPFTIVRVGPDSQLQLAAWGAPGLEHVAFAVSRAEFDAIFDRLRAAGITYGPAFDAVGTNTGPGRESGARGPALTLYLNDPNRHLLEIRVYD